MSARLKPPGMSRRLLIAIGGFVCALIVLLISRSDTPFGIDWGDGEVETTVVVATRAATYQDQYRYEKSYIGQVEAAQRSALGFELSGMLKAVAVEEGDAVAAGTLLAQLDTQRLEARRAEAEAALHRAQAEAKLAQATYQRITQARAVDAVSKQELDEAREGKEMAESAVGVARAQLKRVTVDIDKSNLYAPYTGIVIRRVADAGVVLGAGQPVLEMQERGASEIRIGVSSRAAERLQLGAQQTVHINERAVPAVVDAILPVREQSRTVEVILKVPGGKGDDTRPGDVARLGLDKAITKRGFWVPIAALNESARGLWSLYVAEPVSESDGPATHRLSRRLVEIQHSDSTRAFVNGSVDEGELVVVDGTHKLVPGQAVRLSEHEAGDAP